MKLNKQNNLNDLNKLTDHKPDLKPDQKLLFKETNLFDLKPDQKLLFKDPYTNSVRYSHRTFTNATNKKIPKEPKKLLLPLNTSPRANTSTSKTNSLQLPQVQQKRPREPIQLTNTQRNEISRIHAQINQLIDSRSSEFDTNLSNQCNVTPYD
jgi:hypothetical protein